MSTQSSRSEQRKHQRTRPDQNKPIRVDLNGSNFIDVAYAQDISEGGVRLSIGHGFVGCEIDNLVDLLIKLPEPIAKSIKASGKIRHLTGKSFGISFITISRQDQQVLAKYLALQSSSVSLWHQIKKLFGSGHLL